jgi:uncharacterized protein (TIGR02594 family)
LLLERQKKWHGTKEENITDNYHALTGNAWLKSLSGTNNAWCASFVSYCLQEAGYAKPKNSQRAKSFLEDTSRFVEIKEPVYGCIACGRSHVTFFYGEGSNGFIIGLGGNQGDSIKFSNFKGMRYVVPVSYYEKYKKTKDKTMKKFDVAALGSGNIDIFLSIPSLPTRGGKVVGTRLGEQAGGTVANSACAMGQLGLNVVSV